MGHFTFASFSAAPFHLVMRTKDFQAKGVFDINSKHDVSARRRIYSYIHDKRLRFSESENEDPATYDMRGLIP